MVLPLNREDDVYQAVEIGDLTIDSNGRVWRHASRRRLKSGVVVVIPCSLRRAENQAVKYLQVRVMVDRERFHSLAHRLVWRHFHGPIPAGLTVNHMNGNWTDNRPENLELATYSEQVRHARHVLRRGPLNQWGERNPSAKLTTQDVRAICERRANGEKLTVIAADMGVAMQTVSKISRGERRLHG
jgi:hypothetical protein